MKDFIKNKFIYSSSNRAKHIPIVYANVFNHFESLAKLWKSRGIDDYKLYRNYFEFGVWNGYSFIQAKKALDLCVGSNIADKWNFFGFDSFEGLPKPKSNKDKHPYAGEGAFKSEGEQYVYEELLRNGFKRNQFTLIKGFFDKVLNDDLYEKLKVEKVSFVNLDIDYYSSTYEALNWIKPLLFSGSILYFDDILFYDGNPNKGQLLAIKEFNEQSKNYGLYRAYEFDPNGRTFTFWQD